MSVSDTFLQEHLDQVSQEQQHYAGAPLAFFEAWKRGVALVDIAYFGNGTRDGFGAAATKWDLVPNVERLKDAFGGMSGGERMFAAAMVSFYNARTGGEMLARCDFEGLADLGGLDLQHTRVIADLLLNYTGW